MANKQNKQQLANTPEAINAAEMLTLPTDEFLTKMETSVTGLSSEERPNGWKHTARMKSRAAKNAPVLLNSYCISAVL